MLDIMPSTLLVGHEWYKHGTCTGMGPEDYYGMARKAFNSVVIPKAWYEQRTGRKETPEAMRQELIMANPSIPESAVVISCDGDELSEVRVCLNKGLRPCPCSSQVAKQMCSKGSITIKPLRSTAP